ncbi:MAG TPA: hypothetical protein VEY30_09160, partial [Myxococcaceae bacterium]|nr:hypothetical protein [Myxococcaceae bacterium]
SSLAHLETTDAATERSRGGILVLAAGATWQSGPSELRVAGPGTAATVVHPTPLVFNPLHAVNPAPRGLALTLDFRLESGLALGDVVRLVTLSSDVANVLRIRVDGVTPTTARLVATASFSQGGVVGTAETRWQVPTSTLDAGVSLHAVAEGGTGVVTLYINGQAQPLSDATATPTPPIASPGVPAATSDMELTLGRATGGGNPVAFRVSHLHLWGEALGPFEPALRRSVVAASALKPGDVIRLAETRDGCRAGKRQFEALVVSTQGDEVTLSKPVVGTWTRGRTIVFQEESFLFQTRLLRKDDLLNHLYRCSVDYRASALLDDAIPQLGAPLVERPEVKFLPLGASRSSAGHPGVTVTDVDSTQRRAI